jgi:hypothetical protein
MRVASSGRISVKFDTGDVYEALSLIFKRGYNRATISGSLQEDLLLVQATAISISGSLQDLLLVQATAIRL